MNVYWEEVNAAVARQDKRLLLVAKQNNIFSTNTYLRKTLRPIQACLAKRTVSTVTGRFVALFRSEPVQVSVFY